MTIYEKIVFMTIWVVIHLFFSVGYIITNKIIKTGIIILDILAMWRMYDYFLVQSQKYEVLSLIYNSIFSNTFVLLLYVFIVSIIGFDLKKEKLKKCIKPLAVAGLAIGAVLCLYDTNIKQSSDDYLYDKPYLTIKQLVADTESYDSAHVSSNVNVMRNLIIKKAYIADELIFVSSERENLSIKRIATEYYELSSRHILPEMLMEELTADNAFIEWEKMDSDFFDEIRYRVLYGSRDKNVYITYRYNETVVKVEVFVEKDYDIENIINCLENMYGAA